MVWIGFACSEENKFRQSNHTARKVKNILSKCDRFEMYDANPRMVPSRFKPKPKFKALDKHSPMHISQVGGHDRKKRKAKDGGKKRSA